MATVKNGETKFHVSSVHAYSLQKYLSASLYFCCVDYSNYLQILEPLVKKIKFQKIIWLFMIRSLIDKKLYFFKYFFLFNNKW